MPGACSNKDKIESNNYKYSNEMNKISEELSEIKFKKIQEEEHSV